MELQAAEPHRDGHVARILSGGNDDRRQEQLALLFQKNLCTGLGAAFEAIKLQKLYLETVRPEVRV